MATTEDQSRRPLHGGKKGITTPSSSLVSAMTWRQPGPTASLVKKGEYRSDNNRSIRIGSRRSSNARSAARATRIGIVGGGAAAVATTARLAATAGQASPGDPMEISVFERYCACGQGVAFGNRSRALSVNMLNAEQSIVEADPLDHIKWRVGNHDLIRRETGGQFGAEDEHGPRCLLRSYHYDRFEQADQQIREHGGEIKFWQQNVVDVSQDCHEWVLHLANGDQHRVDACVLALGNFQREPYLKLRMNPGYISTPYSSMDEIERIGTEDPVIVLGTGLSAIEMVPLLSSFGHQGQVLLASPTGTLPLPRQRAAGVIEYEGFKFQTDEVRSDVAYIADCVSRLRNKPGELHLDEIIRVAHDRCAELAREAIDWQEIISPTQPLADGLRDNITRAEAGEMHHHIVARQASNMFRDLYQRIGPEQQAIFWQGPHKVFRRLTVPMPVIRAKELLSELECGRLRVGRIRGKLQAIPGGFKIDYAPQHSDSVETFRAAHVINATGQETRLAKIEDALIQNLLRRRLISSNATEGIMVDPNHLNVKKPEGGRWDSLFALGSLTLGAHSVVLAVKRNAEQASIVGKSIDRRRNIGFAG